MTDGDTGAPRLVLGPLLRYAGENEATIWVAVCQAVCSPIHNLLPQSFRRGQQLTTSRAGELAGGGLARMAGVRNTRIRWRITRGPWFYNMLSALEFEGRKARIRFDRTGADATGTPHLAPVCEADLS